MSKSPFTRKHELACRDVIMTHSQSFFLSSVLLPPDVRMCAWAIYGFCRTADDAIDEPGTPDYLKRQVLELRNRLELIYTGNPANIVDDAFAQYVDHYKVPRSLPECLIDGFDTDAQGVDLQSEADLIEYSFRVASTVGLMLTYAMQIGSDLVYHKASDLGIAMQLTNIARDMGADFRVGRFYVPLTWRENVSFRKDNEQWIIADRPTKLLAQRLVKLSERHYQSARQGIQLLPLNCRIAITASMMVYRAINNAIEQRAYDTITSRAFVSIPKKVFLVGAAATRVLVTPYESSISEGPSDQLLRGYLSALNLLTETTPTMRESKFLTEGGR